MGISTSVWGWIMGGRFPCLALAHLGCPHALEIETMPFNTFVKCLSSAGNLNHELHETPCTEEKGKGSL